MTVIEEKAQVEKQYERGCRNEKLVNILLSTLHEKDPKCSSDLKKHIHDQKHQLSENAIQTLKLYGLWPLDKTIIGCIQKINIPETEHTFSAA